MKQVVFNNTDEAKTLVLSMLGYGVDAQGFVYNIKTGDRAVTQNSEDLTLHSFTGVRPGSEVFFTPDLPSLLEQAEYLES